MPEYDIVTAPAVFTVRTVVPYSDEPEYRDYEVPSDELPTFLGELKNPEIAEQVVWVREGVPLSRNDHLVDVDEWRV